jgi:hypothetical protein
MIVQQLRIALLVGTVNALLVATSPAQATGERAAATTPTDNEEVRLSEILVAAPSSSDHAQTAKAKGKAEELLKRIRNGEDFADIAKSDSDGAMAKTGGDLGFFAHGKLSPSLDHLVFSMKVGDVSDVVQTKQGFVILKVLDKRSDRNAGTIANTALPGTSGVQILSDPLGFNFNPYISQIVPQVKKNWYKVMPDEAQPPTRKKGRVVIEFSLEKDGTVTAMRLGGSQVTNNWSARPGPPLL